MRTTGRRVVSVVFADLVGFTALAERLDPEDVARVQDAYFSVAAAAVERHGGQVEKFIGDAVMATFGTDRADDTDPVRAVHASRLLVRDTEGLGVALGLGADAVRVRVGVNTGEVVVTPTPDGWRVTGDTVNTASRLQAAAAPGQVLLGPETAFGVGHAFVLRDGERLDLRGKSAPLPTWQVVEERPEPRRGLRHHGLHAPMLGRTAALRTLRRALAEAADSPAPAGVVLVAPPGVGKSRLVEEFCHDAAPAGHPAWTVRLGDEPERGYTCVARLLRAAWRSSLATGAPRAAGALEDGPEPVPTADDVAAVLVARGYHPVHAGAHARHTVRLLAGEPLDGEPADLYTAWTAVLDATSAPVPVWVVEDLHLSGPDLRAFLRHALSHPRPGGRLIVVTARPTAGLPRPGDDLPDLPTLYLEPLTADTTRELVLALVGPGTVPDDHVDGIVAAAGGNPLFVEELLRSWIQSGTLRHTGRGWRFSGASGPPVLPSTVQAIYQGQLDALPAGSRGVVERGSVPGVTFPSAALPALGIADPEDPLVDLTRTGLLVGPHEHPLSGEAYTYRHALLRDTAYGSMSRQDRAELHVRFARWMGARGGEPDAVTHELVGRHLSQAVETLPATAPGLADGTPTSALADEAADRLAAAAAGHLVSSPQRAADLLRRALDLAGTSGGPVRLHRRLALAEAERRAGRLEQAMASFAEAGDAARVRGDDGALVTAALGHESALFASRLPRSTWGARSVQLLRAAEAAVPADDAARRSTVLAALGRALVFGGHPAVGTETLRRAVALAEGADDPAALAGALLALRSTQADPASLPDRIAAGARVQAAARRTDDLELRLESTRLRLTDLLEAGDLAGADAAQAEATALVERLRRPLYFWYPPMWRAMRALLAGRYATARELVDRFAVEARRAHYGAADQVWGGQMLRLHLETGRVESVLGAVEHLLTVHPRYSFAAAAVLARIGDREGAQRHLDRCTADDFAGVPDDLAWSSTVAHLAEVAALLDDGGTAERVARRLAPWAAQHVVVGAGAMCLGAGAHYVGLARRTAGDLDGARADLEAAVAMNDALPAPGLATRSRAELARTLARQGDDAGARALARTALATATRLGMTDLAHELRDLADPSGRPPTGTTIPVPLPARPT